MTGIVSQCVYPGSQASILHETSSCKVTRPSPTRAFRSRLPRHTSSLRNKRSVRDFFHGKSHQSKNIKQPCQAPWQSQTFKTTAQQHAPQPKAPTSGSPAPATSTTQKLLRVPRNVTTLRRQVFSKVCTHVERLCRRAQAKNCL